MRAIFTHTILALAILVTVAANAYTQSITDTDDDDDGIPDVVEVCGVGATDFSCIGGEDPLGDADNDGTVNYQDWDFCWFNSAGVCKFMDTDTDGIPDFLDRDSDNDGIPDVIEAGGTDTNGDGRVDFYTDMNDFSTLIDADGDGLADPYDETTGGTPLAFLDTDGDGFWNHLDLDADNDAIPDVIEAGGVDTNGDGYVDNTNDSDEDGFRDTYDPTNDVTAGVNEGNPMSQTGADNGFGRPVDWGTTLNTDSNGNPDYLDLDAEDDGLTDVAEQGGVDMDGDGVADNYTDNDRDGYNDVYDAYIPPYTTGGVPLFVTGPDNGMGRPTTFSSGDQDKDNHLNFRDYDSDNDGITDLIESLGLDTDGDGRVDIFIDNDNDGYTDVYDPTTAGTPLILTGPDNTGDGKANGYIKGDMDEDLLLNSLDLESDHDGITDIVEAKGTDIDNDGLVDGFIDLDNDGYFDSYNPITAGSPIAQSGADGNGDGYPDAAGTADTDSDLHDDFLDIDSDNDGIVDIIEWQPTIGYLPPLQFDLDKDGIDDMYDRDFSFLPPRLNNVDNDLIPDYLDTDTDGDGVSDCMEGWDKNGNGILDPNEPDPGHNPATTPYPMGADSDNDGLLNVFDTVSYADRIAVVNVTNGYTVPTDYPYNSAGTPGFPGGPDMDWREDDATFPVEFISFEAELQNGNAVLEWATATETNSDFFAIERSIDGVMFEQVAEKNAAGNSTTTQTYTFVDANVLALNVQTIYYRLKSVDLDGSFDHSDMVELQLPLILLLIL